MPLSTNLLDFSTATVAAAATSVAAALAVPDNCHTVIIANTDALAVGRVGLGPVGAALTAANSKRIGAGTECVLGIGDHNVRPSAANLRYDSDTNGHVLEITYISSSIPL